MTYLCVPIMVESDSPSGADAALEQATAAVRAGAGLIEWRLDQVADDRELIRCLIEKSPVPCIVTCRPTAEGGEYDGIDADRIAMFEHVALDDVPQYLDVEQATYERSENLAQKIRLVVDHPNQLRPAGTRLILSTHDFSGRPKDLYARITRVAADDACAILKIAWTARSLRDNIEAFELLHQRAKPMIALCMGRYGLMSRVLAPKFGAFLTFARPDDLPGTAPGQPGITQLRNTYHFDRINSETQTYGIIGWPAEHSIGPIIHNAAFRQVGHNGVYLPLPIPPEYEHFKATVSSLIDYAPLDFSGVSITTPHKENALRFAREHHATVDLPADLCGAANTLLVKRTAEAVSLHVANTDVDAIVESAAAALGTEPADLSGRSVAIIGAGGAARAATVGFALAGVSSITLHNRTEQHAQALADILMQRLTGQLADGVRISAAPLHALAGRSYDLIVQTTPVGMSGYQTASHNTCPVPDEILQAVCWDRCALAFELIYTPSQTAFLQAAQQGGCRTLNGRDMFVRQALAQLRLWLGDSVASLGTDDLVRYMAQAAS